MAYSEFAYWYDALNAEADYDRLSEWITQTLQKHAVFDGIVADLGCGTGEISLRLHNAGYDMIAVDISYDMLSVFREKMLENNYNEILLLQQDLAELDLYGTIRAAISTFDTFNHMPKDKLEQAFQKISLFMEPGGLFLFDTNTSYKHQSILANNCFVLEGEEDGVWCEWQNKFDTTTRQTQITITAYENEEVCFRESFVEYAYPFEFWEEILIKAGFVIINVIDGESFTPINDTSQRYLFTAQKIDLQEKHI